MTSVTDAQGAYRFSMLPPGVYELAMARPGFIAYVEKDLWSRRRHHRAQRHARCVILTETISVSGGTPVVDSRQTGVAGSLSGKRSRPLRPRGRKHRLSGDASRRSAGQLQQRNKSGNHGVQLDGLVLDGRRHVDQSPLERNGLGLHDMDAAEEINLVSLGASAEYQQAQGGVMNYVSKAGTNVYRGDGSIHWAPPGLTSVPITRPCNCPLGETGFKLYKSLDYAAHIGGPIVKNRLWFHGGQINSGPAIRYPGQPDRPEDQQWIKSEVRNSAKVTWKINDKMQFQQSLYYEWWNWLTP